MVGAADIITDYLGRVASDEDGAGIADFRHQRIRIGRCDLQMLGGDAVGQRNALLQVRNEDDGAEIAPAGGSGFGTLQRLQLPVDRRLDRIRQHNAVGDEDGLGAGIVFGLGEQVGGQPIGIIVAVGDDEHFRGPRDHVDADSAEDLALGGGDEGIARAGDLRDGRDGLCTIGKGSDGLCAADAINLVDARNARGGENGRVDRTLLGGNDHDDTRHAGHLGRHRIHQNGARIARRAAGNVEADGVDRRPARAETHADIVLVDVVLRLLTGVVLFDALRGKFQRSDDLRINRVKGGVDFLERDAHGGGRQIEAVKFSGIVGERLVAARAHIIDDRAHNGVNVLGDLALGGQERSEPAFEIAALVVKSDRQVDRPWLKSRFMPSNRWMAGFQAGFPCSARICKLNFDAFHIERDGGIAGEHEFQRSLGAFAVRREVDGEQ